MKPTSKKINENVLIFACILSFGTLINISEIVAMKPTVSVGGGARSSRAKETESNSQRNEPSYENSSSRSSSSLSFPSSQTGTNQMSSSGLIQTVAMRASNPNHDSGTNARFLATSSHQTANLSATKQAALISRERSGPQKVLTSDDLVAIKESAYNTALSHAKIQGLSTDEQQKAGSDAAQKAVFAALAAAGKNVDSALKATFHDSAANTNSEFDENHKLTIGAAISVPIEKNDSDLAAMKQAAQEAAKATGVTASASGVTGTTASATEAVDVAKLTASVTTTTQQGATDTTPKNLVLATDTTKGVEPSTTK